MHGLYNARALAGTSSSDLAQAIRRRHTGHQPRSAAAHIRISGTPGLRECLLPARNPYSAGLISARSADHRQRPDGLEAEPYQGLLTSPRHPRKPCTPGIRKLGTMSKRALGAEFDGFPGVVCGGMLLVELRSRVA